MALTTEWNLRLAATLTNPLDLSTPNDPMTKVIKKILTSGVGLNQADRIFHDSRNLAASATEDLDLAGSLTGPLGSTVTFARIKLVLVTASASNANNVNVTRPAANGVPLFLAAGDGVPVMPGGLFWWVSPTAAGVAVAAGTGDLLTFTNSGGGTGVDFDVIIIGASA